MRKNNYTVQRGDVLWTKKYTHDGWEPLRVTIEEIYVEAYVSGPKVMFKVSEWSDTGVRMLSTRYLGDIRHYWETEEDCIRDLKAGKEYNRNDLFGGKYD